MTNYGNSKKDQRSMYFKVNTELRDKASERKEKEVLPKVMKS